MLFVDSDIALGSPRGDVDDAYAIAALIAGGAEIAALSSCRGNTSEELAFANNVRLARMLGWTGDVIRAAEARERLCTFEGRVLALGPLTNVIGARRASEIVIVGGNSTTRGRWPPLWPHEFNLTKDRAAARAVFALDVPLTVFPLDVARQLTMTIDEVPEFLREDSRRWFRHLRLVRWTRHFPVYDLAAALYALDAPGFTFAQTTSTMRNSTLMEFGRGGRAVKLCTHLDRDALIAVFRRVVTLAGQPVC